ncbi:hypothetical protein D3C81_1259790 [compost metagenome]
MTSEVSANCVDESRIMISASRKLACIAANDDSICAASSEPSSAMVSLKSLAAMHSATLSEPAIGTVRLRVYNTARAKEAPMAMIMNTLTIHSVCS